jgi:hypothetical protein
MLKKCTQQKPAHSTLQKIPQLKTPQIREKKREKKKNISECNESNEKIKSSLFW